MLLETLQIIHVQETWELLRPWARYVEQRKAGDEIHTRMRLCFYSDRASLLSESKHSGSPPGLVLLKFLLSYTAQKSSARSPPRARVFSHVLSRPVEEGGIGKKLPPDAARFCTSHAQYLHFTPFVLRCPKAKWFLGARLCVVMSSVGTTSCEAPLFGDKKRPASTPG